MVVLSILQPFGKFYGHFEYSPWFWYIFLRFGMLHPEISGNPAAKLFENKRLIDAEKAFLFKRT
jgi:hypothetical protein